MKKIIFCERCKLEIKKGDKAYRMHTYNCFPEVSDERYFHFKCFLEWLDEKINEKAIKAFKGSMKTIMPMIKPMAEKIANNVIGYNEETNKNKIYNVGTGKQI